MNIIIFIICMFIAITAHELGHYLSSKIFKLTVKNFSLGFGPALFKVNKFNTAFALRLIPLGGSIRNTEDELNKISIFKEWIITLSGVFVNLTLAIISASIFLNKDILSVTTDLFTKILGPFFNTLINPSTYFGAELSLGSSLTTLSNSFQPDAFLLVFSACNLFLFAFNLLPIPLLDGGQLIMSVIRRCTNKSKKYAPLINKINTFIYLFCWILLLSPLIINEALAFFTHIQLLQLFLYLVIGILLGLLFRVLKGTDIYRNLIKKFNL